jgi:alkanesulfonate monooxygenase SsuD/methylene tetrahydromethanopterin reductase-like flavin-dependent oxidoreductase (luciferase family)
MARLAEACAAIKGLLGQARTTLAGQYYSITDAPLEPKPVQANLPLLIGGGGEQKTLRIAARWADEWNTWGDPDHLARKAAVLDQRCEEVGRDPASIRRSAQAIIEPVAPGIETRPYSLGQPRIGGSVEQLRDFIGRYRDAGINEFIVPDWNTGRGQARSDFYDWFVTEVAGPFRP